MRKTVILTKTYLSHINSSHNKLMLLKETARSTINSPLSIWRDENDDTWLFYNEIDKGTREYFGIEKYLMVVVKRYTGRSKIKKGKLEITSWYDVEEIEKKKGVRQVW